MPGPVDDKIYAPLKKKELENGFPELKEVIPLDSDSD